MVSDGTLYAHDGDVYWIDAGTPPTYLTANLDLVRGRRGAAEDGVDPTATVSGEVTESVVGAGRSEEHTSELQTLMRISYAVFCWNTKITHKEMAQNTDSKHN